MTCVGEHRRRAQLTHACLHCHSTRVYYCPHAMRRTCALALALLWLASCTPLATQAQTISPDQPIIAQVINSGTISSNTMTGPGVVANFGTITMAGQASCADPSLPSALLTTPCDTTHPYSICHYGTLAVSAQSWSTTWCQSDSGASCPTGRRLSWRLASSLAAITTSWAKCCPSAAAAGTDLPRQRASVTRLEARQSPL